MCKTGCFWDTLTNFQKAVKKEHKEGSIFNMYMAAVQFIEVWNSN